MSSQPEVYWTWTPSHLTLIPDDLPKVVPSPIGQGEFRAPFSINKDLYNFVLRPEVPIAFASIYMITVLYLNAHNRRNNNAPWAISKSRSFGVFVVAHNILLALYSLTTWLAMGRAIAHSLPDWSADNFNVRFADGLCKLHGPRGLGDAATFNTTINIWEIKNTAMHLMPTGVPDPTDVGRLWNEGLAFWGWIFYMSKFYEVLDTFILIAKGKRSGTLQTYHHAGAMLCMWAGIRYMSPPIWMFVFVNSGIHGLMYTYFALSALGYKVPQGLKRTLTMLQIGQFIWGASYAAAHLFIQYDIPIATPYQIAHTIERVASSATSVAKQATSTVSEIYESPTVTADSWEWIKKLLLRAAGEDGVAERLQWHGQNPVKAIVSDVPFISKVSEAIAEKASPVIEHTWETRYRTEWTRINCIDTTGEAFAIYLNLIYLSPLTWLFLRFFSRAYSQRGRSRSASQAVHEVALSARDAKRETQRSVEQAGEKAENELEKRTSGAEAELRKDVNKVRESWRENKLTSDVKATASKAQNKAASYAEAVKEDIDSEKPVSDAKQAVSQAKSKAAGYAKSAKDNVKSGKVTSDVKQAASDASSTAASYAEAVKENIESSTTTTSSSSNVQESSSTSTSTSQSRSQSSTWIQGGGGLFRRSWNEDTELSERAQDDNLEASQKVRPDPEDDTDAMGRSGAIVNRDD